MRKLLKDGKGHPEKDWKKQCSEFAQARNNFYPDGQSGQFIIVIIRNHLLEHLEVSPQWWEKN